MNEKHVRIGNFSKVWWSRMWNVFLSTFTHTFTLLPTMHRVSVSARFWKNIWRIRRKKNQQEEVKCANKFVCVYVFASVILYIFSLKKKERTLLSRRPQFLSEMTGSVRAHILHVILVQMLYHLTSDFMIMKLKINFDQI